MSLEACLALAVALGAVEAPITSVTVYSDRARITRTASVTVSGVQKIELPLLLERVDPATIRLEATGAEVRRVELSFVGEEELPLDDARKLATQLEKLDDQLRKVQRDRDAYSAQLEDLRRLNPTVPPTEPLKSPPRLDPTGWSAAAAFAAEQTSRVQAKLREQNLELEALGRQREVAANSVRLLLGDKQRRTSGHRVTALLAGNGPAKLSLTYVTSGARWTPLYDIHLEPDAGKVQVSFAGLVSQETGEDWNEAQLTLSTAIPATSIRVPKVATWKIGEHDRFIPTPAQVVEPIRPPPPASPPPELREREQDALREKLSTLVFSDEERRNEERRERDRERADKPRTVVQRPPPPPPPPRPEPAPAQRPSRRAQRGATMPSAAPEAPPPAAATSPENAYVVDGVEAAGRSLQYSQGVVASNAAPLSLSPPPGYVPPHYDPDLPVALAGGYDLAYASLRPETIQSGKDARRVALFSESWPVSVERKVFPGLFADAFLVAEIKSPSKQVLPGGQANLFVGADPAGTARLKLVSPGEAFTLPLGIDRAVRPTRNVKLVLSEKGFIGKDELSEYVVTLEIPNPYAMPLKVRLLDQWPVTSDKNVEIKLLKVEPWAIQDPVKGSLEWHLTIPASGKSTASFSYSIRRPKGWRLHQSQ